MSKTIAIFRAAGAFAVSCVVAPPIAKLIQATQIEAEAQTYGSVSGGGTIDSSGQILPNGTINPNPGVNSSNVALPQKTKTAPGVIAPNGCPPGQVPLLPGAGCPPNARACLPPPLGSTPIPRVPCAPLQQGDNATGLPPTIPSSAVQ